MSQMTTKHLYIYTPTSKINQINQLKDFIFLYKSYFWEVSLKLRGFNKNFTCNNLKRNYFVGAEGLKSQKQACLRFNLQKHKRNKRAYTCDFVWIKPTGPHTEMLLGYAGLSHRNITCGWLCVCASISDCVCAFMCVNKRHRGSNLMTSNTCFNRCADLPKKMRKKSSYESACAPFVCTI